MGEHLLGERGVARILLDTEVVHGEVEVDGGRHADRGDVLRPVDRALDLVLGGEVEELAQRCDASEVRDGRAYVVDQLLGDQGLVVVHRVEDLTDGQRCGRVPADQPQRLLVLGGRAVLQPEQAVRLQVLAQTGGLHGREAVVRVVQEGQLRAELGAHGLQYVRHVTQIGVGVPVLHQRPGLLVQHGGAARVRARHTVDRLQSGDAGLHADRRIALGEAGPDRVEELGDVPAVGVAVGAHPVPARAAQELVERQARGLRLDVPQRDVDGGDRGHRHRSAPPVGAPVERLPGVLDAVRVETHEEGHHMVLEVADDGQLPSVERGVAEAGEPFVGRQLQCDEVTARAGDEDLRVDNFHGGTFFRMRW